MTDTAVSLNDEQSRYEIRVGDTLAGFAAFRRRPGEVLFMHTEVDPAFQGKGLAAVLADDALADVIASGDTIVPYCPFIAKCLRTHEYPGAVVRWPEVHGR